MKSKLKSFYLYMLIAIVLSLLAIGIATKNYITLFVVCFIFIFVAVQFMMVSITNFVEYFTLRAKHKKKIEDKRIEIRVVYVDNKDKDKHLYTQNFRTTLDLTLCVSRILAYAKEHNLSIKSITQLTTED